MNADLGWAIGLWAVGIGIVAGFAFVHRRRRVEPVSRNLPVLGIALLTGLFMLALQALRMQIIQRDAYGRRSGIDPRTGEVLANSRLSVADTKGLRGSILDNAGTAIAWSEERENYVQRRYASPQVAHVAGYFSPVLYGKDGVEESANDALSIGRNRGARDVLRETLNFGEVEAEHVRLTIRADVQREAQELLGVRIGAVVVVEVASGAVIALANNPVVDPGELAAVIPEDVERARAYWVELNADERNPLVRRSTLGLYTPGSIFKVVTAAAAIDSGRTTPGTVYVDDGVFTVDGHTIVEANRPDDTITEWTLTEGLMWSLNVVFAQVGLELGAAEMTRYAEAFGFGASPPFEFPVATGQVATTDAFLAQDAALADTAFGQGELLTTPVHMALLAACVANNGDLMEPYLVAAYLDRDGTVLEERSPRVWRRPVAPDTATQVEEMMIASVESGYAGGAIVPGFRIGGKTGTAEIGGGEPHGWFIGFGGDPEPRFAVSVVLEHGGSGSAAPSSIGGTLLALALSG